MHIACRVGGGRLQLLDLGLGEVVVRPLLPVRRDRAVSDTVSLNTRPSERLVSAQPGLGVPWLMRRTAQLPTVVPEPVPPTIPERTVLPLVTRDGRPQPDRAEVSPALNMSPPVGTRSPMRRVRG